MYFRPTISSHSLGRAWVHSLHDKIDAAAAAGLDFELFYEDLEYVARDMPGGSTPENLKLAASVTQFLCSSRGIRIVSLQPFMQYEGLRDRTKHAARIEEMKLWIQLAQLLNTDVIAIPSTFLSTKEVSGNLDLIVADLREVADLGAPAGIRFAYEALAWGTYISTWEQSWDVVQRVDRPNFELILDTFNIAGRVWANPAAADGKCANSELALAESIARLVSTVDPKKIALVQVADGERLASPLRQGHEFYDAAQPARMSWSRNCRLFYGETPRGAYLPVHAILSAILGDLGYRGPLSSEIFNRCLAEKGVLVPTLLAQRAAEASAKLNEDFGELKPAGALPSISLAAQTLVDERPRAQL